MCYIVCVVVGIIPWIPEEGGTGGGGWGGGGNSGGGGGSTTTSSPDFLWPEEVGCKYEYYNTMLLL